MTSLPMHRRRRQRTAQLTREQPTIRIYQDFVLQDFAWEVRLGLNLAFYRTFAAPRVAALTGHTGEIERQPRKRAYDTALHMYELIHAGFDTPRGRSVVAALNSMHRRWSIRNEDYLYVLATFVVVPARWVDRWGWRESLLVERESAALFYSELGQRMGLTSVPATFEDFAQVLDSYEQQHLASTDPGRRQMRSTANVLADRLPKPLLPLVTPALGYLLGADLAGHLGVARPGPAFRVLASGALRVRRLVARLRPPADGWWFEPGAPLSAYPGGYSLGDLGPSTPAREG